MIAIDPGKNGGIAYDNPETGRVEVVAMPDTMADIATALRVIIALDPSGGNLRCIIERVGYTPGDGGKGAFSFGQHLGHLQAILYMLGVSVEQVSPQTWQKVVGLPVEPVKDLNKQQLAARAIRRKNMIKDFAQRRYPKCKVTLKTADALALYAWAQQRT